VRARSSAIAVSVTAVAGLLAASSGGAEDTASTPLEPVLAGYRTERALTAFLGRPPTACVPATRTTRLCEWVLGNRDHGWQELADAVGTSDRVGVLCELPPDDGERVDGACTGHERRSNRSRYRVGKRTTRTASERAARKRAIEELGEQASAELAGARTLLELSRLLGAAPSSCYEVDDETQRCTWRLTAHERGHGTVAASIGADLSKKVRLRCELPRDGSARAEGSCTGQIGA
jgi:hypothetical protein